MISLSMSNPIKSFSSFRPQVKFEFVEDGVLKGSNTMQRLWRLQLFVLNWSRQQRIKIALSGHFLTEKQL
jgi:hypothetical protein